MENNINKVIVNSWNEWDPLRHVIVGVADGTHIPPAEPALDAKVPEDSDMKGEWGPRSEETVFKAEAEKAKTDKANKKTEEENTATKKASGKQKLKDLGLDDDEIKALMGA